jgi:ABC-type uncharacterized transport system involved in gliding motility auxiliary subunit
MHPLIKKNQKYLFWLGPIFIVMGLAAAASAGSMGPVQVGFLLLGAAIVVAWLILEGVLQRGFWARRSTQASTNAIASILSVLAIVGLVNFLFFRYTENIDLTENQIYSLSTQTQAVVQGLQQPTKVWVFLPPPLEPQDKTLLENYRKLGNKFAYEVVDPYQRPGIAQQFAVKSIGEVYLESGTVKRLVQTIVPQQQGLSERRLTNALVQVSNPRSQKVYFLTGHGERESEPGEGGIGQLTGRLGDENYRIEPLNLAQSLKVPDDAGTVVIAGLKRPLLDKEISALRDYLKRKGGLLLLVDPQTETKVNPENGLNLTKFLDDWGVKLSDRVILDPAGQQTQLGVGVTLITEYGDHPITKGFGRGISFYPLAIPIATKPTGNILSTPILLSGKETKAQRIDASGQPQFDPKTDPPPPYAVGVALSRKAEQAETGTAESRLVIIGDSTFASNGLVNQQLNGDVLLNAVSWLSQRDDQVLAIRPRSVSNRRIVLPVEQQVSVSLLALGLLPVLGFGTAAIVWWRRR